MDLVLYNRTDDECWCKITAQLLNGKLTIMGHDFGPTVERFFGRDEYEYAVSLDARNTKKLFQSLECDSLSDSEKLLVIKSRFENSRADSALREYCDKEGIETSFWSWP